MQENEDNIPSADSIAAGASEKIINEAIYSDIQQAGSASSPGCEAIFKQASRAEEASIDKTSAETRPPGPRYGELACYRCGSLFILFH